jgi:hypothetical protein
MSLKLNAIASAVSALLAIGAAGFTIAARRSTAQAAVKNDCAANGQSLV